MRPLVYDTYNLGQDYPDFLDAVQNAGEFVRPRGMGVIEVRPLVLRLVYPQYSLVERPGINRALVWMEIAQLLAGEYDGNAYTAVAPKAAPLLTEFGAYGPRVRDQLPRVISELRTDPDSRRAVVYIGSALDLGAISRGFSNDMPCTMTWQFFIRGGQLELLVNMRSWDLVWGLTNDVPCFTSVQRVLADVLDVTVGSYTHVAGSAHIYERHWALKARSNDGLALPSVSSQLPTTWECTVADAKEALRCFRRFREYGDLVEPPVQWREALGLWALAVSK